MILFFPMNSMRPPSHHHYPYPYQPPHPFAQPNMYWQPPPVKEQKHQTQHMQQQAGNMNGMLPFANNSFPRPKSNIHLMNAFLNDEGKFDFEKTASTIDQVMKVGNQISPLVKQVGALFSKK